MAEIAELIERLEKATGPDREIDVLIGNAVDLKGDDEHLSFRKTFEVCGLIETTRMADSHQSIWRTELPRYTSSIDAALTLVPEGASWLLVRHASGSFFAEVHDAWWQYEGATPAIALCIAALNARLTLTTAEREGG